MRGEAGTRMPWPGAAAGRIGDRCRRGGAGQGPAPEGVAAPRRRRQSSALASARPAGDAAAQDSSDCVHRTGGILEPCQGSTDCAPRPARAKTPWWGRDCRRARDSRADRRRAGEGVHRARQRPPSAAAVPEHGRGRGPPGCAGRASGRRAGTRRPRRCRGCCRGASGALAAALCRSCPGAWPRKRTAGVRRAR